MPYEHFGRSCLFVIPARGGSQGVVNKNLRRVGGVPLVARAIRTARRTAEVLEGSGHRVVCTTDSDTIAEVAQEWGADVPFLRPKELSTDTASSLDVVRHVVSVLNGDWSLVVLLQPTSPLTIVDDVLATIHRCIQSESPAVTICPSDHPIEWTFRLSGDDRLERMIGCDIVSRRQDGAPSYRLNGAVYAASIEHIKRHGFLCSETRAIVMPGERSIDVDTELDLSIANGVLESRKPRFIEIGKLRVGRGNRCFLIAEAGVNHNGEIESAKKLVKKAKEAGADAIKFQTFSAERLAAKTAPKAKYQETKEAPNESQIDMLRRLELSENDHHILQDMCNELGIIFLSSPFDEASADFLESLGVDAYKIPSGELTNHSYLSHISSKGKPLIVSTGMSTISEIDQAYQIIKNSMCPGISLLHCVSSYPAPFDEVNLRAMKELERAFDVPVGFSDHTVGIDVAVAAVALGACIVEKHFTLDRGLPGPDHKSSIEPDELAKLAGAIRTVELSLGDGRKQPKPSEREIARVARKSLFTRRFIGKGEILSKEMLVARRPGTGVSPSNISSVIGRTVQEDIKKGEMLSLEMLHSETTGEKE